MPDQDAAVPTPDVPELQAEIVRLNKTIQALMDRAERSASSQESDYSRFQVTVMLEDRVRRRTVELEAALAENEKINRALHESEGRFRGVVSQSLVGITVTENGRFTYSNAKFNEMFGYTAEEIRQLGPGDIATEEDRPMVAENVRRRVSGEIDQIDFWYHGVRKDGAVINIEVHGSVMEIGGKRALISVLLDVTERFRAAQELQRLQDKLREQSIHDGLTGLYNRFYLDDFLGRELMIANRAGYPVSAIMADLDHFKAINDRHGHLAGDEVLRALGALMKQHGRGSDMASRYGGEEFLLVLPGMAQDRAIARAEQLRRALEVARIPFGALKLKVTASFGVATFPADGATADALISAADAALYASKAAGRNRVTVARLPDVGHERRDPVLRVGTHQ